MKRKSMWHTILQCDISVVTQVLRSDMWWSRARLLQVYTEKELLADVFLLDYGLQLERVRADTRLRVLPPNFAKEPAAFQIILSGLSPVSMDLDMEFKTQFRFRH